MIEGAGIIMMADSVRALLAGRKTQTRRIAKVYSESAIVLTKMTSTAGWTWASDSSGHGALRHQNARAIPLRSPWVVGQTLYVKEAFWRGQWLERGEWVYSQPGDFDGVAYFADGPAPADTGRRWVKVSPLFMPRWCSRLDLMITDVRFQRVKQITHDDAVAEGLFWTDYGRHQFGGAPESQPQLPGWSYHATTSHDQCHHDPVMAYAAAYNQIHAGPRWNLKPGPSPWDENEYVWAATFTVSRRTP